MGAGGDPGDKFIDTIMAAYNEKVTVEMKELMVITDTETTLHRLDGTTITTTTTTKKITRL